MTVVEGSLEEEHLDKAVDFEDNWSLAVVGCIDYILQKADFLQFDEDIVVVHTLAAGQKVVVLEWKVVEVGQSYWKAAVELEDLLEFVQKFDAVERKAVELVAESVERALGTVLLELFQMRKEQKELEVL